RRLVVERRALRRVGAGLTHRGEAEIVEGPETEPRIERARRVGEPLLRLGVAAAVERGGAGVEERGVGGGTGGGLPGVGLRRPGGVAPPEQPVARRGALRGGAAGGKHGECDQRERRSAAEGALHAEEEHRAQREEPAARGQVLAPALLCGAALEAA